MFDFKKIYDQNDLYIVKSTIKIIIHVLKLVQKIFECFTSKPNAHGTFRNLNIEINYKINISETSGPIELKSYILSILKIENTTN